MKNYQNLSAVMEGGKNESDEDSEDKDPEENKWDEKPYYEKSGKKCREDTDYFE